MSRDRRSFIKKSTAGILGLATLGVSENIQASNKVNKKGAKVALKLGIASYSLRKFSMIEALEMTKRCGLNRITFKSMHLPLDASKEEILQAVNICKEKGVELYGAGVIYMKSEKEVDEAFEYAKTAQMKMIVGVPNHNLLKYVEQRVKEYNIKLAIHNHGPGDKLYPSAESAYVLIKNMDSRMGLCIDIGHTKRIHREPEQDVEQFFDRVFDIHLKDVTKAEAEGKTCIIGHGVINFPLFLKSVVKLGYKGTLALEYEAEADDPLPGMAESIGYIKGILTTL